MFGHVLLIGLRGTANGFRLMRKLDWNQEGLAAGFYAFSSFYKREVGELKVETEITSFRASHSTSCFSVMY